MALTKAAREARKKAREKAKLKTVKDKIEDKKGLLTNEEVFTSYTIKRYLQDKVKTLLKDFGIPNKEIYIRWDTKENAGVACTNNHSIFINAGCRLINSGTRTESFRKLCGVLAHELGHVLFTNFTESNTHIRYLASGTIYPTIPSLGGKYEDNRTKLIDFLDGKRGLIKEADPKTANRMALCSIMNNLSNILEDGREEEMFTEYCSKYRTLYEGLLTSEKEQKLVCAPLPKILDDIKSEKRMEFEAIMQIMLHYARFGEISGYDHKLHKDEAIVKKFREITRYCDDYIEGYSSSETLNALNSILIVLFPIIEDYILKMNERKKELMEMLKEIAERLKSLDGMGPSEDSGEPIEGEGTDRIIFRTAHPEKFGLKEESKKPEKVPDDAIVVDLDELLAEDDTKSEESASESDTSESDTSEGDTSDSSESSKSSEETEDSPLETEEGGAADLTEECPKADSEDTIVPEGSSPGTCGGEDASETAKTSESPSGSKGGSPKPGGDVAGSSAESLDSTKPGETTVDGEVQSEDEEESEEDLLRTSKLKEALETPLREEEKDFKDIEEELVIEKEEDLEAKREEQELSEFMGLIDLPSIHEMCVSQIIRPKVTERSKEVYDSLYPELQKIAKLLAKKADFFNEEDSPVEITGKLTGKKFRAERVARADYKYFSDKFPLEPAPSIKIIISVDMSGSMGGINIQTAMKACLLMYLFAKMLPTVDLAIIGDTEIFGGYNEKIYVFKSFESDIDSDKYRICTMCDHSMQDNRDGYALRYCKELLSEQEGDKKLLIRISDGLPAATNYHVAAADADIKNVCSECDKEGIAYIAAAIDYNKEEIKQLYGERHFLDITDLNKLPTALAVILARLLR